MVTLNVLQSNFHQFWIRKEMRRLWVAWAVIIFCGLSEGAYQNEPLHYVALQGDLNVAVDRSENLTAARVINKFSGQNVAEWKKKENGGNVTFPCGSICRAGSYQVQLLYDDDRWIDQQELKVSWPPVLVQAPSQLVNYRTSFQVKIQWIHLKCYPPVEANITINAQVVHCGLRNNGSLSSNCTMPLVRASQPVLNIWQTGGTGTDILFDCRALDLPGYYRVFVLTDQEDQDMIGSSESIHVELNEDFQLQVRAKYAAPCRRELPVFYHRPACVTGSQDRVRLYGKNFTSNLSSSDFTLRYIGEKVLDPNRSVAAISCQLLEDWTFDSLCFHYVTLASTDGAVIEISQTCIPNQDTSVFQEPEWGSWSEFSACTSRNCGYKGVRYRYRYCDHPTPRYAGSFCQGQPIESVICETPSCPQKEITNVSLELEDNGQTKENLTSECMCGCTMELGDGTFSLVVSSALCPNGSITWVFTAPSYSHFHLGLDYLRLDCRDDDQLKIRDGVTTYSPLIAVLDGQTTYSTGDSILTTSYSQLMIELTRNPLESFSNCVAGFVTSITSIPKEQVIGVERRTKLPELALTPVMTMSTLLLMLLCAVSVLVVLYSKCGVNMKHGRKITKRKRPHDGSSLWSEASEYQLVSTTTSMSSIDTLTEEEVEKKQRWIVPTRLANLMRLQKSLPNSPFLSTGKGRQLRLMNHRLSRSSTMSPIGFRRQQQTDTIKGYSPNGKRRQEDIEMSLIIRTESETTLKEEKVLNTVSSRVLLASQSLLDTNDASSVSRSTMTQSCSAIFDPDQDLEFDYYDLDVRNAGCDAPDSFLRCLADDSTYWDERDIQRAFRDPDDCESLDESIEMGMSFDEDDVSSA